MLPFFLCLSLVFILSFILFFSVSLFPFVCLSACLSVSPLCFRPSVCLSFIFNFFSFIYMSCIGSLILHLGSEYLQIIFSKLFRPHFSANFFSAVESRLLLAGVDNIAHSGTPALLEIHVN